MICRRPIADAFWGPIAENPGFVEGHTFEGNPISCAAGLAVLREILERDLLANARAQGERLRERFEELARKYPVIGDIRGKGLFQAIEFVRDRATKERFPDATALRRPGRPAGARARPALPVRPPLDRLRPAAGRHGRADRRDGGDPRPQPRRGARRAGDRAARRRRRAELGDRHEADHPSRPGTACGCSMYLRFVRYLLWEFRWPLAVFAALVLGGGLDPPPVLRPRGACRSPGPATPSS